MALLHVQEEPSILEHLPQLSESQVTLDTGAKDKLGTKWTLE